MDVKAELLGAENYVENLQLEMGAGAFEEGLIVANCEGAFVLQSLARAALRMASQCAGNPIEAQRI